MLDQLRLDKLLCIDIETVPGAHHFDDLSGEMQALFELKTGRWKPEDKTLAEYYLERGGILAEFGRVVCISAGFLNTSNGSRQFRVKSFAAETEADLLSAFGQLLAEHYRNRDEDRLCGHNVVEFDVPFICRRMLVNHVPLPAMLNLHAMKPWEVPLVDTMDLWKFGDRKNFTSLRLLTAILGIPTSKDDIQGSDVGHVYWELNDLPRIVSYCQKDVIAVMQIVLRFRGQKALTEDEIVFT